MKRKIKLDVVYWIAAFVSGVLFLGVKILEQNNITSFINDFHNLMNSGLFQMLQGIFYFVLIIIFFVFLMTFVGMIVILPFTILYFAFQLASKVHNVEKFDASDKKNSNYFRDLCFKYSPATLSYIMNFKIEKKDIVASLLMLELKGKITIKDGNYIVSNNSLDNLEENEKFILKKVEESKLKNINIDTYLSVIKKDAIKAGFLQEKAHQKNRMIVKGVIYIIMYLLCIVAFTNLSTILEFIEEIFNNNNIIILLSILFSIIMVLLMFIMPLLFCHFMAFYKRLSEQDSYVRSKKGKYINQRLNEVRNFLIEFSNIETKTKEQLVLWDRYLVYSVFLGVNTKVVDEICGTFE